MPSTSFRAPEAGSQGCIVGVFKVYSCYGTCESDSQILINCERCQGGRGDWRFVGQDVRCIEYSVSVSTQIGFMFNSICTVQYLLPHPPNLLRLHTQSTVGMFNSTKWGALQPNPSKSLTSSLVPRSSLSDWHSSTDHSIVHFSP